MKIVRRYEPEDLPQRIEAGHQRAREVIRQVPLLRIVGWDGPVMLGEFGFDGTSAGAAHLTPDYRPARQHNPPNGGRVDTLTRPSTQGSLVSLPWDDPSKAPRITPKPTGQLALTIDGERLVADTWYRRGEWASRIVHEPFVTTISARGVPLRPIELCVAEDLEPLLAERRRQLQDWADLAG